MSAKNEISKIYETILSVPGMNENVKVNLQTSRKNVLLLSKVIERGLHPSSVIPNSDIVDIASAESLKEIEEISKQILERSGLMEMNERLKAF